MYSKYELENTSLAWSSLQSVLGGAADGDEWTERVRDAIKPQGWLKTRQVVVVAAAAAAAGLWSRSRRLSLVPTKIVNFSVSATYVSYQRPSFGQIVLKRSATAEIARRRSLSRSRSIKLTNFDTYRKPVCDFILVNNINEPLHSGLRNLTSRKSKKLETSLCRMVWNVFQHPDLKPFRPGSRLWRIDGQTDRMAFRNSAL